LRHSPANLKSLGRICQDLLHPNYRMLGNLFPRGFHQLIRILKPRLVFPPLKGIKNQRRGCAFVLRSIVRNGTWFLKLLQPNDRNHLIY